jgi:hypothetical protein
MSDGINEPSACLGSGADFKFGVCKIWPRQPPTGTEEEELKMQNSK